MLRVLQGADDDDDDGTRSLPVRILRDIGKRANGKRSNEYTRLLYVKPAAGRHDVDDARQRNVRGSGRCAYQLKGALERN